MSLFSLRGSGDRQAVRAAVGGNTIRHPSLPKADVIGVAPHDARLSSSGGRSRSAVCPLLPGPLEVIGKHS